jgi:hypothetical protein
MKALLDATRQAAEAMLPFAPSVLEKAVGEGFGEDDEK